MGKPTRGRSRRRRSPISDDDGPSRNTRRRAYLNAPVAHRTRSRSRASIDSSLDPNTPRKQKQIKKPATSSSGAPKSGSSRSRHNPRKKQKVQKHNHVSAKSGRSANTTRNQQNPKVTKDSQKTKPAPIRQPTVAKGLDARAKRVSSKAVSSETGKEKHKSEKKETADDQRAQKSVRRRGRSVATRSNSPVEENPKSTEHQEDKPVRVRHLSVPSEATKSRRMSVARKAIEGENPQVKKQVPIAKGKTKASSTEDSAKTIGRHSVDGHSSTTSSPLRMPNSTSSSPEPVAAPAATQLPFGIGLPDPLADSACSPQSKKEPGVERLDRESSPGTDPLSTAREVSIQCLQESYAELPYMPVLNNFVLSGKWRLKNKAIGKGAFGVVFQGRDLDSGSAVAVKMIKKYLLNDYQFQRLVKEVKVAQTLNHPNIVKYIDFCEDQRLGCIVMELCRTDVRTKVEDRCWKEHENGLPEQMVIQYLTDVLKGLIFIHESGFGHRDLKPENVLISFDGCAKLGDFGLVANSGDFGSHSIVGTPAYMAPEVHRGEEYDAKQADSWSLAVTAYYMLCSFEPFETKASVLKGQYVDQPQFSPLAKDWLGQALVVDAYDRINSAEMLKHPWITPNGDDTTDDMELFDGEWPEDGTSERNRPLEPLQHEVQKLTQTSYSVPSRSRDSLREKSVSQKAVLHARVSQDGRFTEEGFVGEVDQQGQEEAVEPGTAQTDGQQEVHKGGQGHGGAENRMFKDLSDKAKELYQQLMNRQKSDVTVTCKDGARYVLIFNAFQHEVFRQFGEGFKSKLSLKALRTATEILDGHLRETLEGLVAAPDVDAQLLLCDAPDPGDFNDETRFWKNPDFYINEDRESSLSLPDQNAVHTMAVTPPAMVPSRVVSDYGDQDGNEQLHEKCLVKQPNVDRKANTKVEQKKVCGGPAGLQGQKNQPLGEKKSNQDGKDCTPKRKASTGKAHLTGHENENFLGSSDSFSHNYITPTTQTRAGYGAVLRLDLEDSL